MHIYDIRDIWTAIYISVYNFFIVSSILTLIMISVVFNTAEENIPIILIYFYISITILLVQSILIYRSNRRYFIDLSTGLIKFPRSDVENSILEILLLLPYWNLMRTITIPCINIENIYIDTKKQSKTKRKAKYAINIIGTFGSAKLQFIDRQKRDEVRNAIQQCVKEYTGKNIDKKVAEFAS